MCKGCISKYCVVLHVVQLYLHNTAQQITTRKQINCTRPQHDYPVCMCMQRRKPCIIVELWLCTVSSLLQDFLQSAVLAAGGAETATTMH